MKKRQLAQEVAERTGIDSKEVEIIIDNMLSIMMEALKAGEGIGFKGFGSIKPVVKKEREIFIPGTGKKIKVESKVSIQFRPSKTLKDYVNTKD